MDFKEFRDALRSRTEKEKLDSIFEDEIRKKKKTILDEIRKDRLHLELVNFCANLFIPGLELNQKTGYKLLLVEPLFTLGIKNFDLAVFRNENRSLLLIECKHSISNVKKLVQDVSQNISETERHRTELEELIGSHVDQIEYVLCAPAIYVNDLLDETVDQDIPVCVWGCDRFTKEIRLFSKTENVEQEIESGRVHKDKNLSKILFQGVISELGVTRSVPILLSSHMGSLLIHVNQYLYLERISQELENVFTSSDVYNVLLTRYQKYTQISEEDAAKIAEAIIAIARRKGIYEDLTPDIIELENKTFKVSGRQTNARVISENTHKKYVVMNAQRLAEKSTIKRFKEEIGFTGLNKYAK